MPTCFQALTELRSKAGQRRGGSMESSEIICRSKEMNICLASGAVWYKMNVSSYLKMRPRLFFAGLALWLAGTIALRLAGQHLLHPESVLATLLLFAVSFLLMAFAVRGLCRRFRLPREEWLSGAVAIAAPTLLLDPFSSAFFPFVFPNIPAEAAGVFGGWMLICCAGALLGVVIGSPKRP